MQPKLSKDVVNIVENDSAIELWHKWLGHMSEKSMICLVQKNALPKLD